MQAALRHTGLLCCDWPISWSKCRLGAGAIELKELRKLENSDFNETLHTCPENMKLYKALIPFNESFLRVYMLSNFVGTLTQRHWILNAFGTLIKRCITVFIKVCYIQTLFKHCNVPISALWTLLTFLNFQRTLMYVPKNVSWNFLFFPGCRRDN